MPNSMGTLFCSPYPVIASAAKQSRAGCAPPARLFRCARNDAPVSDQEARQVARRIARAARGAGREHMIERVPRVGGNGKAGGGGVFLEPSDMAGAGDRHDEP